MKNIWRNVFFISIVLGIIASIAANITYSAVKQKLNDTETQLNTTAENLNVTALELNTAKTLLNEANIQLDSTKSELDSTQNKLNYNTQVLEDTQSNLENTQNTLDEKKIELLDVSSQLSTAKVENLQTKVDYSKLRSKILSRVGLTKQDRQSYITPDDLAVTAKVLEITGSYPKSSEERWSGYLKLYSWVVDNIEYSSDSGIPLLPIELIGDIIWKNEFWRMPAETLKDKTGDCEDMALLLINMMENFNQGKFTVWTLSISSKYPEPIGHMGVVVLVEGGELAILDPAGNYYTGMYNGYLNSDPVMNAVDNWLAHWSKEMPGAIVDGVMSESVDEIFSNTTEFITWFNLP